jgi:itaconate CoA-transferase
MYRSEYRNKLIGAGDAVFGIADGSTIVHGMANAEPPALLEALADRVRNGGLRDLRVFSMFPLEVASRTILAPDLADKVRAHSWFLTKGDRDLTGKHQGHFVPCNFHEIPRLCRDFMKIDVMVTAVSPMDKAGYFSFGTVNDYTSTAARHCGRLIVEVNEKMPRVFGDSLLHVSEVDAIVEHSVPLVEVIPSASKAEDEIIGKQIAELVPDQATIQLGIGGIPSAVTGCLEGHRDLGVHSELFCPGMVDLIKKGVITGKRKNQHPRKHVFTNALGTTEMYEFMHDNPSLESYPVSYTNAPSVIASNDKMVSINATIEVDLTGQCNSEYLGGTEYGGTGGQLDFVRGAFHSKGGKSIIGFRSTARDGEVSRIVPRLEAGAVVSVPRMDTHYLVTEYGVANLKGRSTRERTEAIIGLAHPKFRDDLVREAEKIGLL